jgi:serine phosphatase RsbU (regulator of sigma subunit)
MVARWRAATATLRWVNCGHPPAYLIDTEGELHELVGVEHPALGVGQAEPAFEVSERRLHPGERLVLITDGVTGRHVQDGGTFGVEGLRAAIQTAEHPTAACTAMAIHAAVTASWSEPLEDDATVVVMAVA